MKERLLIVLGTVMAYTLLFLVNDTLFGFLSYSAGVNWIYLPSGLRLAFVLIFAGWGALGVSLASMLLAMTFYFGGDLTAVFVTGLISGLAPYLARHLCHTHLGMDLDLKNLTHSKLLTVSVVFALMSATMHQVFFVWQGYTENFLNSTVVMAFGDLTGTVIMLYLAKFLLSVIKLKTH